MRGTSGIGNITEASSEALQAAAYTSNDLIEFRALQYALFTTCFVEVLGGLFFVINAFYIVKDKAKVDRALKGKFY